MDGLKPYVNDDRFRVDGDKNMRLLAFAFTIVFVWTGPQSALTWEKGIAGLFDNPEISLLEVVVTSVL